MSEGSSDEAGAATCPTAARGNPVAADGRRLLAAFSMKQSTRFQDFKQSWNELQFSFVYW